MRGGPSVAKPGVCWAHGKDKMCVLDSIETSHSRFIEKLSLGAISTLLSMVLPGGLYLAWLENAR